MRRNKEKRKENDEKILVRCFETLSGTGFIAGKTYLASVRENGIVTVFDGSDVIVGNKSWFESAFKK